MRVTQYAMLPHPEILLVDDDFGIREGLSDLLSVVAPVTAVATWQAARSALEGGKVGLVVSDWSVRETEGDAEFLSSVKARGLALILCTGAHPGELQAALKSIQPDAVLVKPFDVDEILGLARKLYRAQ